MEFSTWICNEVFFSLLYSFLLLLFQVLRLLLVSSLQTICNILQLQPLYNSLQAFDLNISKLRYYLIPDIWISSVFKKNSCNFTTSFITGPMKGCPTKLIIRKARKSFTMSFALMRFSCI